MSVLIIEDLFVRPGKIEDLRQGLSTILPETRAYDGCEYIDLLVDTQDGTCAVFVERWKSEAHYEAYAAYRKSAPETVAHVFDLFTGPPTKRILDYLDTSSI